MKKILLITSFISLLTACSCQLKGTITEKKIIEEKADTMFQPVIQAYQITTYPKVYQIVLDNGLCYDVTKQDYDRLQIGDTYVYGTKYQW